jgi:hypothetical protein
LIKRLSNESPLIEPTTELLTMLASGQNNEGLVKIDEENLDEIKELMDAPMATSSTATSSTATSSTATSSTATSSTGPTTFAPAPISTRRKISNRLRDLIKKLSLKPL